MNPWERGVWYLSMAMTAAVLVRLAVNGLFRVYRFLFLYLLTDLTISLLGLRLKYTSSSYGLFYFRAQTIKIVIAAFVVVELYSLALENQPALAQYVRNGVGYILLIAAAIAAAVILFDQPAANAQYPILRRFLTFERTMDGSIAVFLILISAFMAWFPVRHRRNAVVYIAGFVAWFLSRAAAVHLSNYLPKQFVYTLNVTATVITLACLFAWFLALGRKGEGRTAIVGHLWNLADAARLTGQLDAINHSLERFKRRQF